MSTSYASGMDGATARLPHEAAEGASDSVGGAHEIAAEIGGAASTKLITLADQAFIEAMTTAAGVAAAVALAGALIAAAFLPSRAKAESPAVDDALPEPAAA